MEDKKEPREVFVNKEYKILEKSKVAKDRHYLVVSPSKDLTEGIETQYSFFKNVVSKHLDEIMEKIKNDFKEKFGKTTGFRICVNFGSAGTRRTPHIHILPVAEGEKIKPRLIKQWIEKVD